MRGWVRVVLCCVTALDDVTDYATHLDGQRLSRVI